MISAVTPFLKKTRKGKNNFIFFFLFQSYCACLAFFKIYFYREKGITFYVHTIGSGVSVFTPGHLAEVAMVIGGWLAVRIGSVCVCGGYILLFVCVCALLTRMMIIIMNLLPDLTKK